MRLFIAILLASVALTCNSEIYTIAKLNTPSILINGTELKTGDEFSDTDKIEWRGSEIMHVVTQDKRLRKFMAQEAKGQGKTSIKEMIQVRKMSAASTDISSAFKKNYEHLSTRSTALSSEEDHTDFFSDEFLASDTIFIDTAWKTDEHTYFTISYDFNGETIAHKLVKVHDGKIVISPDMLPAVNNDTTIVASVHYVEEKYNEQTLLTDKMQLTIFEGAKQENQ